MKIKSIIVLSVFIPVIAFAQPAMPNVGSQNQVGAPKASDVPSAINTVVTTTQSSSVNGSGNTNLNGSYGNTWAPRTITFDRPLGVLMQNIVKNLSDEDAKAVSVYLSTLN